MDSKQYQASALLILVAAIWGTTFVVVKLAIADIPPFTFNAIRFAIAFLSLIIFYPRFKTKITIQGLKKGLIAGLFLFGGYSFQTMGLEHTGASKAAFITGLAVVLVAAINCFLNRQLPSWQLSLGILFAIIGLGLLTFSTSPQQGMLVENVNLFTFNLGDALVLIGAICFAVYIILVDLYTKELDTLFFTTGQIATVALASFIFGYTLEGLPINLTPDVIKALLITAIPATTLAYFIQNWAQKYATPSSTAIILALEPVFALAFAWFMLHEPLTRQELLGAALMLAGMIIAEMKATPVVSEESCIEQEAY